MRLKSEATQVAKETAIIGEQQTLIETLEKRVKELEKNLQKAFDLGQKYEHYSEHEFVSYNKKAADIMAEFKALTINKDSK